MRYKIGLIITLLFVLPACTPPTPTPTPTIQNTPTPQTAESQFLLIGISSAAQLQRGGWTTEHPVFSGAVVSLVDKVRIPLGGRLSILCNDELVSFPEGTQWISEKCTMPHLPFEINSNPVPTSVKSGGTLQDIPYVIQPRGIVMTQTPLVVWNAVEGAIRYEVRAEAADSNRSILWEGTADTNYLMMDAFSKPAVGYRIVVEAIVDNAGTTITNGAESADPPEGLVITSFNAGGLAERQGALAAEKEALQQFGLQSSDQRIMLAYWYQNYEDGTGQRKPILSDAADQLYTLYLEGNDTPPTNLLLADIYLQWNDLLAARARYQSVLVQAKAWGDLESCAIAHWRLATIYKLYGDDDSKAVGQVHYTQTTQAFEALGDTNQLKRLGEFDGFYEEDGQAANGC